MVDFSFVNKRQVPSMTLFYGDVKISLGYVELPHVIVLLKEVWDVALVDQPKFWRVQKLVEAAKVENLSYSSVCFWYQEQMGKKSSCDTGRFYYP